MINRLIATIVHFLHYKGSLRILDFYERLWLKNHMGYCGKNVYFGKPQYCLFPNLIYLHDRTTINPGAVFILSPSSVGDTGRFIMKKNSTAAQNLTVINHNHTTHPQIGVFYKEQSTSHVGDIVRDIVIEEDAFVGANVTLCAGVVIGRGAIVGAGSVIRKSIPPYSVAYGNPAKVRRFVYTPEQILEHEKRLYPENERFSYDEIVSFMQGHESNFP